MSKNAEWINKEYCFFIRQGSCATYPCCCAAFTWLMQRYNRHTPKSKFFRRLIYRTSKVFHTPKRSFIPLFTGISARFPHPEKNEIGIYQFFPFRLSKCINPQYQPRCIRPQLWACAHFLPLPTHSNFQLPPWIVGKQQKKTYLCSKANTNCAAHHFHSQLSRQRVRAAPTTSKYPHPLWKQPNP